MLEVLTNITTVNGSGKVAVMHFGSGTDPVGAVPLVRAFWAACANVLHISTKFNVLGNGRVLDPETGELTGFYNVAAPAEVVGVSTDQMVPDAAQALVQWRTGVVRAGREIRGRTFIPGLTNSNTTNGNLSAFSIGEFREAGDVLTGGALDFGIWSRPIEGGRAGAFAAADSSDVWPEMAVLRRRRG